MCMQSQLSHFSTLGLIFLTFIVNIGSAHTLGIAVRLKGDSVRGVPELRGCRGALVLTTVIVLSAVGYSPILRLAPGKTVKQQKVQAAHLCLPSSLQGHHLPSGPGTFWFDLQLSSTFELIKIGSLVSSCSQRVLHSHQI